MSKRRGAAKGSGSGYKNLPNYPKDPKVHSMSAKGMKQPQNLSMKNVGQNKCNHVYDDAVGYGLHCVKCGFQPSKKSYQPSPMKDQELAKIIRNLDPFMQMMFNQQLANGVPPKKALEVVVNSVEGDKSQLTPEIIKYAEKQGWFKGYDDRDGDGVPDAEDCDPDDPTKQGAEHLLLGVGGYLVGRGVAKGVQEHDTDKDGIPDMKDKEPDKPNPKVPDFVLDDKLTEQQVLLLKRRLNDGKIKPDDIFPDMIEKSYKLTPQQQDKGLKYLKNLWQGKSGKERKNNPFGGRVTSVLANADRIELVAFQNIANFQQQDMGIKNFLPVYKVVGKDGGTFEYRQDPTSDSGIRIIG